ncbi:hypothetical protein ASG47_14150 [Devosia sp. Leaf420]|uniref:peptidase inhibitor family I36 protein n=1 Tax=Devosia sp. Leaf420 TaxID=1736374 RepID=UPI0007146B83|nr:peptidase inhibitor family I36 protein [Devosia sp. Leaf420]KQT46072.1 hypothetical protein ASG47_14150 [Devosia sp. Leaf420]
MKAILLAAAAALGLFASVSSAQAEPAFATTTVEVYSGPGWQYGATGYYMNSGLTVDANCFGRGWCQVNGNGPSGPFIGWVEEGALAFGGYQPQPPRPQPVPQPPRPQPVPPPDYEDAGACFYAQRNFRGDSFCVDVGEEYPRLPRGWDQRIRSVEVFGDAEVDLCTDSDLYGRCVTLRADSSRLPSGLDRRVRSLEVY